MNMKDSLKNKRVRFLVAGILIVLIAAIYVMTQGQGGLKLKGIAETTMYTHTSKVSGMIENSPLVLGQSVKQGDILFEIDKEDKEYAIEQMEQTLIQKKAALALLEKGSDAESIRQGENNVASAKASYNKAHDDYLRTKSLYEEGAASKSSYDTAKYALTLAQTALDNAGQQLAAIKDGADAETILSAKAQVSQTESQLRQLKDSVADYTIRANCNGTVMSINYTKGDMVAPGYNLCDLAAADEMYVLAYLPAEDVDLLEYGDPLTIQTKSGEYEGTVAYIDVKSEYTPKDMQTSANKNKNSFKIKIAVPQEASIKPGQEVMVILQKN